MDKIWAPWRETYVTQGIKKQKGCIFCQIEKNKKDMQNLVLTRTDYCYAVMNIYPYNNGHVLILPNRHVNDISRLKKNERENFMDLLDDMKSLIQEVINPDGFNVGMNLGKAAGAGVPGHLHMHIVPRWNGDVNFMPVVSKTKVISQSIKTLHKALTHAYKNRN